MQKPALGGLVVAERPERSEMKKFIDAVVESYNGNGTACGFGTSSDPDDATKEAAAQILEHLRGLSFVQADQALNLASSALRLAATVPR